MLLVFRDGLDPGQLSVSCFGVNAATVTIAHDIRCNCARGDCMVLLLLLLPCSDFSKNRSSSFHAITARIGGSECPDYTLGWGDTHWLFLFGPHSVVQAATLCGGFRQVMLLVLQRVEQVAHVRTWWSGSVGVIEFTGIGRLQLQQMAIFGIEMLHFVKE